MCLYIYKTNLKLDTDLSVSALNLTYCENLRECSNTQMSEINTCLLRKHSHSDVRISLKEQMCGIVCWHTATSDWLTNNQSKLWKNVKNQVLTKSNAKLKLECV